MDRIKQLVEARNRLNELGEPTHYYLDHARDTVLGNSSAWNRKRIRVRNKINARLRKAGA
jgi:hypothetical protein